MIDDEAPINSAEAYDGDYWRERASRVRAEAARNGAQRRRLAALATGYEKLAQHADALQREAIRYFNTSTTTS